MKNILALSLAMMAAFTFASCKKDAPIESTTDFTDYLESEMESQKIPAMAVLVFDNANVLHESYLGQSNRATGLPLESDHLFLLASISKTITATALLRLHDEGNFQLDDAINNHLPFKVDVPGSSTPITFRMLLTHTSGIADGPALDGQYYNGQDSPTELATFLENYLVPGGSYYDANQNFHDFEPGTMHEYSNVGSALIGVLVEHISGMGFNAYCKQHIFEPLGMNNTFWRLDEISGPIAVPYDYYSGSWETHSHYTFTDYPNGGLRSTARDMHIFIQALANNGMANGYQLLKSETVSAMLSPQIPAIDAEVGLSMFVMNSSNGLWGHDGGEKGTSTIMAWNPNTGIGAIVFTNQGEAELDNLLEEAYLFGKKQ